MITFKKTPDKKNEFDNTTVQVTTISNDLTLPELLEVFEDFLKAVGYNLNNKRIEVVEE